MRTASVASVMAFVAASAIAIPMLATATYPSRVTESPPSAITPLTSGDYLIAAPGRVEPASETIRIASPVTGVLKEVLVKEGDRVKRGDILARVESEDLQAGVGRAEAELQVQEATLLRLQNGARAAERNAAEAAVREAEAVQDDARVQLNMQRTLLATSVAPRTAVQEAETRYAVAQQKREAAVEKFKIVNDPAREEDIAIAEAKVRAADAARDEAQAILDKTVIHSPIDGTVLRIYRHPGELLSIYVDEPVLSLGDISTLYVRAEVDEADIAKLELGMPAFVTASSYQDQRFPGRVVRIGEVLGRKELSADEPQERTDTKVLEVLVALDAPNPLRPGLRVDTFMTGEAASGQVAPVKARIAPAQ